jgi:hypothetical protein
VASETNYELKNAFRQAVWDLTDGECIEHPADAFEQSIGLIYDLLKDEDVIEVIASAKRRHGG